MLFMISTDSHELVVLFVCIYTYVHIILSATLTERDLVEIAISWALAVLLEVL